MPQALSKVERPASRSVSMPAGEVPRKRRLPSRWSKFKHRKKSNKEELPSVAVRTLNLPAQEDEDWEKEIEEFSLRMEKQKEKQEERPYDPEDELNVAMDEMTLYAVPRAPSPNQDHYSPSKHHLPPVKWTRYIYARVAGQFADAEE